MLTENFVSALNWLGLHSFVFDLGIDLRSGGLWQYNEAMEMMRRAPATRYIVNHLGKPDLRIPRPEVSSRKEFLGWKYAMSEFAKYDSYVKLSGAFSELPPLDKYCEEEVVYPWASAVDSVCTLGVKEDALRNWKYVCDRLVDRIRLSDEEK
ncbi:hypothetical protein V1527DRAFT_478670 [Lipomyces starkeyi]